MSNEMIALLILILLLIITSVVLIILVLKNRKIITSEIQNINFNDDFINDFNNIKNDISMTQRDVANTLKEIYNFKSELMQNIDKKNYENISHLDTSINAFKENILFALKENIKYSAELINTSFTNLEKLNSNSLKNIQISLEGVVKNIQILNVNIENRLNDLTVKNQKKLEDIEKVVNEQLRENIRESLKQSFQNMNHNMSQLQKELVNISNVTQEVNALQKVLRGNKTAGNWGEIMLKDILNDILGPDFFYEQYQIDKKSQEKVDFAVKLPGHDDAVVILPIDSKFNIAKYQAYLDASKDSKEQKRKELYDAVRSSAKTIGKYIDPPKTTNFAIMYIPSEGIYAEISANVDLTYQLRNSYSIIPAGPNNIVALLNSLKMGFQTLAIQKKSLEVLQVMKKFRKDFNNFSENIENVEKNISQASLNIGTMIKRKDVIDKTLEKIEDLSLEEGEEKRFAEES